MTKRQTLAFAALCLFTASAWIAAEALPSELPALQAQSLRFLLLAIATAAVSLTRKSPSTKLDLPTILCGLALFAAPLILLEFAQDMLSSSFNVLVFAFVPVAIAIAQGQIRWLAPSLAGVAGILFLVPISLPATPRGWLGLALVAAAMLLTTAAILALHRRASDTWSIAVAFLATALVITLANPAHTPLTLPIAATEGLRALLDAPAIFLLLYLIPRLDPRRLSARWLIAPAITVIEGYLSIRPPVDTRFLLGLALLATGGIVLFAAPDDHPEFLRLN